MIYFLEIPDGPIKVGHSTNPEARLASLQAASPYKLQLLGTFYGSLRYEHFLHGQLRQHRIRGEWYEREPALKVLETLRAGWVVLEETPEGYVEPPRPRRSRPKKWRVPGYAMIKPGHGHASWRVRYRDPLTGKTKKVRIPRVLTTEEQRFHWVRKLADEMAKMERERVAGLSDHPFNSRT